MDDMYKLSSMMKDLFPSNPAADMAALKQMANAPQQEITTTDYVTESAKVKEGSLQIDKDYSISDFAALAGVKKQTKILNEADGVTTAIAHIDKELDVGDPVIAASALGRAVKGDPLTIIERKELKPYLELFQTLIMNPSMRARILSMADIVANDQQKTERKLTKPEEKEKERIVKGMKKSKGDFQDRYGKDAKAVMYATATKNAKQNASIDKSNLNSIKERLMQELTKVDRARSKGSK